MKSNQGSSTLLERARKLFHDRGILRPNELVRQGIPRKYLGLLESQGAVQKSDRGLYVATDHEYTQHHSLALVAKRMPNSVICLLSALSFHKMTTQSPHQVWVALKGHAWPTKMEHLKTRIIRLSGASFDTGITVVNIEGVPVKIYGPAKTVVDCFKFRNKIGLDIALEALRDFRSKKLGTMDELYSIAKTCREDKVMRPYLEALA